MVLVHLVPRGARSHAHKMIKDTKTLLKKNLPNKNENSDKMQSKQANNKKN